MALRAMAKRSAVLQRGMASRPTMKSSMKFKDGSNVPKLDLRRRKAIEASGEAVKVAMSLKRLGTDPAKLETSLKSQVSRLVRVDMLALLHLLQTEGDVDIALKVFEAVRKEHWYKPSQILYYDMIRCLCSSSLANKYELLSELLDELDEHDIHSKTMFFMPLEQCFADKDYENAKRFYDKLRTSKSNTEPQHYRVIIQKFVDAGLEDVAKQAKQDHRELVKRTREKRVFLD